MSAGNAPLDTLPAMGHAIQAVLLAGICQADAARRWDVVPVSLARGWSLVHITHYFSAYWQAKLGVEARLEIPANFGVTFPAEGVLHRMVVDLAGGRVPFAVIMTDYFGGVGDQWAVAFPAAGATPSATGEINEV